MMTLATLERTVPSIFATQGGLNTSDRYKQIPTIQIVEQLEKEGFEITKATQTNSRSNDKRDFAKHMLRFRHKDATPTVDGLFPEVILVNSHDGSSCYSLMAGIYRFICQNGLIVTDGHSEEIKVRHQGDIVGNVIEGTYTVIENAKNAITRAAAMREIQLTPEERLEFAAAACAIKFEDSKQDYNPLNFLMARNHQDNHATDLFSTFNVVQENIIKGGIRTYSLNDKGQRVKRNATKAIKGIDTDIKLNKALWSLAEKMLQLKTQ